MALVTYTEEDLQAAIHAEYEGDADTPNSSDDEYLYRRVLMNTAVNRWENNLGTLWNELWTDTVQDATGATVTLATGTADYACPTNFRFPGGYVFIMDGTARLKTLPVIKPEDAQSLSTGGEYAHFKGNYNSGHEVVVPAGIAETYNGKTLKYDFYKRATKFDSTDDVPEMGDPYYIVHSVVATLYKSDNNTAFYTAHLRDAEDRLRQMTVMNMQQGHFQSDLNNNDATSGILGM